MNAGSQPDVSAALLAPTPLGPLARIRGERGRDEDEIMCGLNDPAELGAHVHARVFAAQTSGAFLLLGELLKDHE